MRLSVRASQEGGGYILMILSIRALPGEVNLDEVVSLSLTSGGVFG